MSKLPLLCLLVLFVALISEAEGGKRRWRKKWDLQKQDDDDNSDDTALANDDNLPVRARPNRMQRKLRKQKRRRNRFRLMTNGTSDNDAGMSPRRKAKWLAKQQRKEARKQRKESKLERKQRKLNKWRMKMVKRGCLCLDDDKLRSLRELIKAEGREADFPEIVLEMTDNHHDNSGNGITSETVTDMMLVEDAPMIQ